jgi:predicted AlkP superfamily phosphohydrolase/phosphomutase
MSQPKLLVIGLDCAEPSLVFDRWKEHLPNFTALTERGIYGKLKSTVPPITVPAWTSMLSSLDPGQLGIYGFRNRKDHSYDGLFFANNNAVKAERVWDILSRHDKRSIAIGVPQTYPPRPLNGSLVASFLTPDKSSSYTYPDALKEELDRVAGGYIIDVEDFRTDKKEDLLIQIYQMTNRRFKAVEHFLKNHTWDFFMFVEMGLDRIHHGFWRYSDPKHRLYEAGNIYENVILKYYIHLDKKIGEILKAVPENTTVLVVSDHGAKTMIGGICINEWLQQKGYLALKEQPSKMMRLTPDMIDWSRTSAWGEGGYYSRIFMNVNGREPQGIIEATEYENARNRLINDLEGIEDENGKNIGTRAFKPQDIYKETNNVPPDLVVYLGNLDWRSIGSVGTGQIHVFENDTGPDDANHAQHGMFILAEKNNPQQGTVRDAEIYDIAPTVLDRFGIKPPDYMIGQVL